MTIQGGLRVGAVVAAGADVLAELAELVGEEEGGGHEVEGVGAEAAPHPQVVCPQVGLERQAVCLWKLVDPLVRLHQRQLARVDLAGAPEDVPLGAGTLHAREAVVAQDDLRARGRC